jgi:hypothetical protein
MSAASAAAAAASSNAASSSQLSATAAAAAAQPFRNQCSALRIKANSGLLEHEAQLRRRKDKELVDVAAAQKLLQEQRAAATKVKESERKMLEARKAPLKAYLMQQVIPVLTKGLIEVCNRKPEDLYLHGLNRESFLPFIRMLNDKCHVHDMNSDTDYRLTGRHAQVFFAPVTDETHRQFNKLFQDITSNRLPRERIEKSVGRDDRFESGWEISFA